MNRHIPAGYRSLTSTQTTAITQTIEPMNIKNANTIRLGITKRMRRSVEPVVGVPDRSTSNRTGCSRDPGRRSVSSAT